MSKCIGQTKMYGVSFEGAPLRCSAWVERLRAELEQQRKDFERRGGLGLVLGAAAMGASTRTW